MRIEVTRDQSLWSLKVRDSMVCYLCIKLTAARCSGNFLHSYAASLSLHPACYVDRQHNLIPRHASAEIFHRRIEELRKHILQRPEQNIAVVTHSGVLEALTGGYLFRNGEIRTMTAGELIARTGTEA